MEGCLNRELGAYNSQTPKENNNLAYIMSSGHTEPAKLWLLAVRRNSELKEKRQYVPIKITRRMSLMFFIVTK